MSPDTEIEDLERERLPEVAKDLCGQGYRLVQMMGNPRPNSISSSRIKAMFRILMSRSIF